MDGNTFECFEHLKIRKMGGKMPLTKITPFASFSQEDRTFIADILIQARNATESIIIKIPPKMNTRAKTYLKKKLLHKNYTLIERER